jgi:GxxExxY protein
MTENELSGVIIGAAIEVHRELGGPGLLEDVYEEALCHELQLRGLEVQRQVGVAIEYKGKLLRKRLVIDLLVNDEIIIEVKSVEVYHEIFQAQLLTYLRLTKRHLGLVINFGERYVKDGVHRVVNG